MTLPMYPMGMYVQLLMQVGHHYTTGLPDDVTLSVRVVSRGGNHCPHVG